MQAENPATAEKVLEVRLQPARLDLTSVKTQMILGLALTLFAAVAGYARSLSAGFLLDDLLHVEYVARAIGGDWHDLMQCFTGNWAGSDFMKSYRPVVSLSLFVDYLLWGTNAVGFHITNVLLLFAVSALVGLITLELTGLWGNRLGAAPAVWAALLFAVYPLHPEAVSWIIGRVDLLCSLFYLGSLFAYMRFRRTGQRGYFVWSLGLFVLSLASKEMAVSLPIAIFLLELFVYSALGTAATSADLLKTKLSRRCLYLSTFFLTLGLFTLVRWALIGTLVGGYGSAGLAELIGSLRTFLDRATLAKIIFPLNEEVPPPGPTAILMAVLYIGGLVILAVRLLWRSTRPGAFLFSLLAASAMVAPTFQVWHIHPNLVGSRLFFLSSAPMCIFFALACLPACDTIGRAAGRAFTWAGTAILFGVFIAWSSLLLANQTPWVRAGEQMSLLRAQVENIAASTPAGKRALLINLPTDVSGAGMVTRAQYLEILLRPPFCRSDLSGRVITIEPPVSGSHDFMWPGSFAGMLAGADFGGSYIWDRDQGGFSRFSAPKGGDRLAFSFARGADGAGAAGLTTEPADVIRSDGERWHRMSSTAPCLVSHPSFTRIYPGASGVTIFLPETALNPLSARLALVDMDIVSGGGCGQCLAGRVKLVWRSADGAASHSAPIQSAAAFHDRLDGRYVIWLGRYRAWTLNGTVRQVGFKLEPGDYFVDLKGITVGADDSLTPALAIVGNADREGGWHKRSAGRPLTLSATAERLAGVEYLRLTVTPASTTYDAESERLLLSPYPAIERAPPIITQEEKGRRARFRIDPPPGLHQARVIAIDKFGLPVGLPSEPVTFQIEKR